MFGKLRMKTSHEGIAVSMDYISPCLDSCLRRKALIPVSFETPPQYRARPHRIFGPRKHPKDPISPNQQQSNPVLKPSIKSDLQDPQGGKLQTGIMDSYASDIPLYKQLYSGNEKGLRSVYKAMLKTGVVLLVIVEDYPLDALATYTDFEIYTAPADVVQSAMVVLKDGKTVRRETLVRCQGQPLWSLKDQLQSSEVLQIVRALISLLHRLLQLGRVYGRITSEALWWDREKSILTLLDFEELTSMEETTSQEPQKTLALPAAISANSSEAKRRKPRHVSTILDPNKTSILVFGRIFSQLLCWENAKNMAQFQVVNASQQLRDFLRIIKDSLPSASKARRWVRIALACVNNDPRKRPSWKRLFKEFTLAHDVRNSRPLYITPRIWYWEQQSALLVTEPTDSIPDTEYKLAQLWYRMAGVCLRLSDYDRAYHCYLQSLHAYRLLCGPYSFHVGNVWRALGHLYHLIQAYSPTIEYTLKAIPIFVGVYRDGNPLLRRMHKILDAAYIELGQYRAARYHRMKAYLNRDPKGNDSLLTSLDSKEANQDNFSELESVETDATLTTAKEYTETGNNYARETEYAAALECYELAAATILAVNGNDHPQLARTYEKMAETYTACHELKSAIDNYKKAITIFEKRPETAYGELVKVYNSLGLTYVAAQNYKVGLDYYLKAEQAILRAGDEYDPLFGSTWANIGEAHHYLADSTKALQYLHRAEALLEGIYGDLEVELGQVYLRLHMVYFQCDDLQRALMYNKKTQRVYAAAGLDCTILQKRYKKDEQLLEKEQKINKSEKQISQLLEEMAGMGRKLFESGCLQEARDCFENLRATYTTTKGEKSPEVAWTLSYLGRCAQKLHDHDAALEYLNQARDLYVQNYGEVHRDVAKTYTHIAAVYRSLFEHENHEATCHKVLQINLALGKEDSGKVARSQFLLGVALNDSGHYNEAIKCYAKTIEIYEKKYGKSNTLDIAVAYSNMGLAFNKLIQYKDALAAYTQALQIYSRLQGETAADVAATYNSLGGTHLQLREYDRAIQCHLKAQSIYQHIEQGDNMNVAYTKCQLGSAYQHQKMPTNAVLTLMEARQIYAKLKGEHSFYVADVTVTLGDVMQGTAAGDKALDLYLQALAIYKNVYGEDSFEAASTYKKISSAYQMLKQYKQELEASQNAQLIYAAKYGQNAYPTADADWRLGTAYLHCKQYPEAIAAYSRARDLFMELLGETNRMVANVYESLGAAYQESNDYTKAIESFESAELIHSLIYPEGSIQRVDTIEALGLLHLTVGNANQAIENFNKAKEIYIRSYGENCGEMAQLYVLLATAYINREDYGQAAEWVNGAIHIYLSLRQESSPAIISCYCLLSEIYLKEGKHELAIEYATKAEHILVNSQDNENDKNIARSYKTLMAAHAALGHTKESAEYRAKLFALQRHR